LNSITDLLDLEDSEIIISDISIQGQTKTLTIETAPSLHFCPQCGFRMHSRGVKKRTINHPILQDTYFLVLILKQRRWRCTNPECGYDISESFKFVDKQKRSTNATDMLIVSAYSDRQYRKQMDFEKVLSIIREVSGTQLNPEVVDAFFRLVDKGEIRAVEARETAGNESLPD
jgi:predicted RNA-binding Zn-ribbon protein involved in translation (DUF1610 family)